MMLCTDRFYTSLQDSARMSANKDIINRGLQLGLSLCKCMSINGIFISYLFIISTMFIECLCSRHYAVYTAVTKIII